MAWGHTYLHYTYTYVYFTSFLKSADASSLEWTAWGHLSSQIICSKSESLGLSATDILNNCLSWGGVIQWIVGYLVAHSYDNQKYLKILLNILRRQITASTILLFRAITLSKSQCVLEEEIYIE